MTEKDLSLMADIMNGVAQSDEWGEIQKNDPGITAAQAELDRARERARAYLPREVYDDLCDAEGSDAAAYCDAAILYGMHVAATIQAVAANPAELSRFWLERRRRNCPAAKQ